MEGLRQMCSYMSYYYNINKLFVTAVICLYCGSFLAPVSRGVNVTHLNTLCALYMCMPLINSAFSILNLVGEW